MLVLSRRENEVICIGSDIRITICRINPGKVRVGIECPRAIPVNREEVVSHPHGEHELGGEAGHS